MARRAAILVQRERRYEERAWPMLLDYAHAHHLTVITLVTRDPTAAAALVLAHAVDVVVAVCPDDAGVLLSLGDAVQFLRPVRRRGPATSSNSTLVLISAMLRRGGTPEMVAQLLAVDVSEVRAVAAYN
jgi:hypothetical protein